MIYFARCGKWLKIGFSENGVKQRIESFRTGNPEPIEYFGEVEGSLSKELHRYFRLADFDPDLKRPIGKKMGELT